MDPVSQAFAGATFSQSLQRITGSHKLAFFAGALSGMAADLDVLIRSDRDPLLFLEYHRHFTHSLVFIPLGGLLVAGLLYLLLRRRTRFTGLWLLCVLGYASHGLLDACTSYGTQLFWPFSDVRIAWDIISIIDPLFTIPVIVMVLAGLKTQRQAWPRAALLYGLCYLCLGYLQHERAMDTLHTLAASRGHLPVRTSVRPSLGNIYLWKLIYEYDGRYYVDAARVGLQPEIIPGDSVPSHVDAARYTSSEIQLADVERFRWFSDGYIAHYPGHPEVIGDMRYSMLPNEVRPLWGIRLKPDFPEQHIDYVTTRDTGNGMRERFLAMLFGNLR